MNTKNTKMKGGENMTKNDFLPEGYSGIPETAGNYMKLEDGENRFRVLSSAITGFLWWEDTEEGRRPKRVKTEKEIPLEVRKAKDNRERAKHFWAFVVYNYSVNAIQILELKQATIMRGIQALVANPKWGSPKEYDIVITKEKTGSDAKDVEYTVTPDPKEPIDEGMLQLYKDMGVNLNALYEGKDPFDPDAEITSDDLADDAAANI